MFPKNIEDLPIIEELRKIIPPKLYNLLLLFFDQEVDKSALYREGINYKIKLRSNPNRTL